jgi:hypothetical protein
MTDARAPLPNTRHLISINDLTNVEIERVFDIAAQSLETGDPSPDRQQRRGGARKDSRQPVLRTQHAYPPLL